jgi:hypothetical protein
MSAKRKASPLVGEVGGGPAASAAEKTLFAASPARAADAPPPNPPHKGEGSNVRKFAKRAGTVVLAVIAVDLVATAATAIVAWAFFQK